ncbi:sensor histidine kinase [Brevibacterium album]|uniref:sensor histidine kinase n=1 Tax=Brevibacterium album TaxID=417948 RepID=UPI001B7FDCDC|nr:histidine kinase [Brevibacterium album]
MSTRPPAAMRETGVESYRLLRRAGLRTAGTLLGFAYGLMLFAALVVLRWSPGFAVKVQRWDRRRLERFYRLRVVEGSEGSAPEHPAPGASAHTDPPPRPLSLAGQALISIVGGYLALHMTLQLMGTVFAVLTQLLVAGPLSMIVLDFAVWTIYQPLWLSGWVFVLASGGAAWLAAEGTAWLTERWVRRTSTVERTGTVEDWIGQLITTRRGVVRAIDDERRRIERDLHDGVQQHTISLSMLLARARRSQDPERVAELLERAHTQSQELIEEMRQVAWRIYPAALDDLGLNQALTVVAQNSLLPVELHDSLTSRPAPEVESATYFVAREAVTNTVKHAGATAVRLTLETVTTAGMPLVRLVVSDDGRGGADPQGSGLQGLRRRVEALDGAFSVNSPAGGPTVVTAEIPYE